MKQVHEITYNGITYKDGDIIKFKWGLDNSFTFIGEIQAIADTFDFITIVEKGAICIGKFENVISKIDKVKIRKHKTPFNFWGFLEESIKDKTI